MYEMKLHNYQCMNTAEIICMRSKALSNIKFYWSLLKEAHINNTPLFTFAIFWQYSSQSSTSELSFKLLAWIVDSGREAVWRKEWKMKKEKEGKKEMKESNREERRIEKENEEVKFERKWRRRNARLKSSD